MDVTPDLFKIEVLEFGGNEVSSVCSFSLSLSSFLVLGRIIDFRKYLQHIYNKGEREGGDGSREKETDWGLKRFSNGYQSFNDGWIKF